MADVSYELFLGRIIDDGIEAARHDYRDAPGMSLRRPKREGSVAGFEACRGKQPHELAQLLAAAQTQTAQARRVTAESRDMEASEYWYHRCYEAEVEWVCNCVSALLQMLHRPTICDVTYRGLRKALEIVNPEVLAQVDARLRTDGHDPEGKVH